MKREYNYGFGGDAKKLAKAIHANAPVSLKYSTELAREIKGRPLNWGEKFLQDIIGHKRHLPLRRYRLEMGHRKGKAQSHTKSGRYPKNCCKTWLKLLKSLKANADYKGMDSEKLIIVHAFASMGFRRRSHQSKGHIGGRARRKKSSHLEIIAREAA